MDNDLAVHLEKFLHPEKTKSVMITDLIDVTVHWISNLNANVSEVYKSCRDYSDCIMEIKQDTANRSGSSIIGDEVEKFMMSMSVESIERGPDMSNCYKCPKAGRPTLEKENANPSATCKVFEGVRWKQYV